MKNKSVHQALLAVTLGLPTLALAHAGADAGAHHGFMTGFAHPFTGIDHVLAMLLVGVCSASLLRRRWLAPMSFAAMLLVGALLASAGLVLPAVEPAIALSLVLLGALLAARSAWPAAAMSAVAALFALFHGAAHGAELAGLEALAGMVLATALLHTGGLVLGFSLRGRSLWWPRAAGLAVSLFGALLFVGVA